MDQPTLPTAAELGITEAEYERILREVQQRRGTGPIAPVVVLERRSLVPGLLVAIGVVLVLMAALFFYRTQSSAYAFTATIDGKPVTYSSCSTIQVAVYPAGGPPDAEQLVSDAVARMRSATGLDIVLVGSYGGHAPNWNFEAGPVHREDPISVSWQDADAIAELTDEIAGLGGSRVVSYANGSQQLVAGTIALSRDYYASLHERGDRATALAVLLHEFGHVFGLDHVGSTNELMYGHVGKRTTFGEGDLEGLRLLGEGPCM